MPGQTRVMTLADAVRAVMNEWTGEQVVDVFIATSQGAIQGLDAVNAIHQRQDFPLPKTALSAE